MVVGICTGLRVCLAVPDVLVAGGDVVSGGVVIANREMERVGAGATLLVEVVKGVNAGGSVCVVVPSVRVAGIMVERLLCTVIDGKV